MTASYSYPFLLEHEIFIPDAWKSLIPLIFYKKFHGNLETTFNTSRTIRGRSQTTFTRRGREVVQECPLFVNVYNIM